MLKSLTDFGVTGRACRQGLIAVDAINPRDFTEDKHRTVDERPYGGGPGMVMMTVPLKKAIEHARSMQGQSNRLIYLSPQGTPLTQEKAQQLSKEGALILLAGRYEGIDQRLLESEVDEEISIGDFVVSGGELPAMLLIDAIARCVPDVLGHRDSAEQDSFSHGLLDCPHYTRPEIFEGKKVPEVLLSGDHEAIRRWRLQQSLGQSWLKRPDLLAKRTLSNEEARLLQAFKEALTDE